MGNNNATIENAEQVIERFGGIRPMASKMDIPVTTVQGWKKRKVIPGNRRDEIIKAAKAHDVDLSGVVDGYQTEASSVSKSAVNQNKKSDPVETKTHPKKPASIDTASEDKQSPWLQQEKQEAETPQSFDDMSGGVSDQIIKKLAQTRRQAVTTSVWITMTLLVFTSLGAAFFLMPLPSQTLIDENSRKIGALENDMGAVQDELAQVQTDLGDVISEQSFFRTVIPEDLGAKIESLQIQADAAQAQVNAAMQRVQQFGEDVTTGVIADNAGTLEQRLDALQNSIDSFTSSPEVADIINRFQTMAGVADGQAMLDQSVFELNAVLSTMQVESEAQLNETLDQARIQSNALSQTFENVPANDLKAAALLLGMSQFRSSLNRDKEPFAQDLALLMQLVGDGDPALAASLNRLAPYSEQGVLTPEGLTTEFKTITGEVIVESLQGKDVSMMERLQSRLGQFFQVEKNGESLTGTPTQNTMAKAEQLLEQGDIQGAVQTVQTLEGPAAQAVQPWLQQALATLAAQDMQQLLSQNINQISNLAADAADAAGVGAGGQLIQDKERGINVLKPNNGFQAVQ